MNSERLDRSASAALVFGVILGIAGLVGAMANAPRFFQAYLFAWLFWCGMALGGFGLLMMHHLVGGRWGFPVRRFFEAGVGTLPWVAVGFVPLLFGLHDLYAWANPAIVHADEVLQRKQVYLNPTAFIIRMLIYFGFWIWMMIYLRRLSRAQDSGPDPEPTRRMRTFSGPGVVLFFLTATFADIDLVLSLEPDWYSTVFAAIIIIGNALAVLAFSIVLLARWSDREPYARLLSPEVWHHLGNLLLAFVMLWAYLAFSQLLVIYSGNLPNEIVWYLHRCYGGWKTVALLLGLMHFAIPFAILLFRKTKRRGQVLARIAWLVLIAHVLDIYWLVIPTFAPHGVRIGWLDVLLFVAFGAIWTGAFLRGLIREPLVPLNDPRLPVASVV